ncbi:tachylectin-related carbohydrate-binding protein [Streptomyces sp. HMX87]|uniref:tachylectin-related carbohydrate-binding protein n=1 Tax=Streptomyces sp. HMX87 TaxID=3390849 RepID=UPI003A8A23A1
MAGLAVAAATILVATPASAAPSTPDFGPSIDAYAANDPQDTCDPTVKPGTQGLLDLLNEAYGFHTSYFTRACNDGGTSEHKEGRALDYMLNYYDSGDRAVAEDILTWLLKTDKHGNKHANARRLGIMYLIWNNQIWSSSRAADGWREYSGSNPHRDHIHFSLSWAGARKQTSWWQWEEPGRTTHSVTGDSFSDLVASKSDGTMWLYSNNFLRDDGKPYSSSRQIGHGWNNYDRIIPADATGDGFTDLVALKPDGTMWLYSNNFIRDDGKPYSSSRQIGHGWNNFNRIIAADATGDGFTDLVALKPDGTMWLYSNNFIRDDGKPYSSSRQIGHGWNNYDRIIAADATGDGFTDLVALKPDGTMWLYSNNFIRDDGKPYSSSRQIGHGWNNFNRIIAADATGDGFTDLVALKPDGTMWLYSNNFIRDDGKPYSSSRQIGHGWNNFNRITA